MQTRPSPAALVERAVALTDGRRRALLGIAGLPGAGKTTLARWLVEAVAERLGVDAVAHVPMDGFHLADIQLERRRLLEVKGAPETFDAAGYAAMLARLRTDEPETVYVPGFERDLEQPIAAAVAVPRSARLVVTEGNYLLLPQPSWAAARAHLDEVWQVEVDDAERLRRLVARHVEFGKSRAQAAAWVARSDQANAARIRAQSGQPDLVVSLLDAPR